MHRRVTCNSADIIAFFINTMQNDNTNISACHRIKSSDEQKSAVGPVDVSLARPSLNRFLHRRVTITRRPISSDRRLLESCPCAVCVCKWLIMLTLYGHIKTAEQTDRYTATRWFVHWPLMGGLLHLVQRGGPGRAAALPRPLLAVPNATAHPSTACVPTAYLLVGYTIVWSDRLTERRCVVVVVSIEFDDVQRRPS